ncbi:MAG: prepilin-type N-terminal cleavage/methylation domain-containing protein [Pirellulales bacterium]|nr:prepilin-type N-terminal cleavage/methylation domain-containing protein [Pirellulales bacterium]
MRRRGFTLIEMVSAITAATVLMGIAVCLLCVLMRAEGNGREHLQRNNSLDLLADRFRRDVHAAVDVPEIMESSGAGDVWVFPLAADPASHCVEYDARGGFVTRKEHGLEKPDRWETYVLPKGCSARIETETAADGRLVRLVITPKDVSVAGGRKLRIEAVLGRDHRFARRAEGSE